DFMKAANGVTARYLASRGAPSLRRVLRTPKKWSRIVALAAQLGETLPAEPTALALNAFLGRRRLAEPARFADLSLCIVKLLGRGEYWLDMPGQPIEGHFGLAVNDYTHSTAPNRRFPDLLTQRLLKSALMGGPSEYSPDAMRALAAHCTVQEDNATKVQRQVGKSAAALLLAPCIGQRFDGIVTGAAAKGTWVRILSEYLGPLHRFRRANVHDTIVFFGSARLSADGPLGRYYHEARELARLLTLWSKGLASRTHRYVICSGGGGGIMEAANRGAAEAGGRTIGLNISLPHEQRPNAYVTRELSFEFRY